MDILLGLPFLSSAWAARRLMLYLLIIISLDMMAGTIVTFQLNISRTFTLPRMGYRRWWLRVTKTCAMISCIYTLVLSLCALTTLRINVVLTAAVLFCLNAILLTLTQSCLLVAVRNATAVFSAMTAFHIISLFFSQYLPAIGRWLPGNWGMWERCDLHDQAGFPIGAVLAVEIVLIALMIWIGPRIVKRAV